MNNDVNNIIRCSSRFQEKPKYTPAHEQDEVDVVMAIAAMTKYLRGEDEQATE